MRYLFSKLSLDKPKCQSIKLFGFYTKEFIEKFMSIKIRRRFFFKREIDEILPKRETKIDVFYRELTFEDIPYFKSIYPQEAISKIIKRFSKEVMCLGAFDVDKLIMASWYTSEIDKNEDDGRLPRLQPGEIYCFDNIVHPKYRNLGIASGKGFYENVWLHRKGFKTIICMIDLKNIAARKMNKNVGYFPYVVLYAIDIWKIKLRFFLPLSQKKQNMLEKLHKTKKFINIMKY